MAQTLSNVRVSSSIVNTEQLTGTETKLCYIQLTSRGAKGYADGVVPDKGMTMWASLEAPNLQLMGLTMEGEGTPAIMGKAFDNDGSGSFADADFSLFGTVLPDAPTQEQSKQYPIAKLKLVEDDRSVFRGDPRGTLSTLFSQVELRTEDIETEGVVETWLVLIGIA
jgi:hypothetical protein